MGLIRYSWEDPYNVVLAVVVAELLEVHQLPQDRHCHNVPPSGWRDAGILRTAGKEFIERHTSVKVADLVERVKPFRHLIPVEQGCGVSRTLPASEEFIDAIHDIIAPVARELNKAPLED